MKTYLGKNYYCLSIGLLHQISTIKIIEKQNVASQYSYLFNPVFVLAENPRYIKHFNSVTIKKNQLYIFLRSTVHAVIWL